ncbi:hypothetical protein [Sphingomonas colocasiae]|uniref:hypothetical protein n=1 Tax=Sphingomonas colocasiae TaxID=1848973 RepID=UPI001FE67B5B
MTAQGFDTPPARGGRNRRQARDLGIGQLIIRLKNIENLSIDTIQSFQIILPLAVELAEWGSKIA